MKDEAKMKTETENKREVQPEHPWPSLHEDAYHGLIGKFVQTIAPYSEADPVAILLNTLDGLGCLIGPGPYAMTEYVQHPARLNILLVGRTAGGRKGLSWGAPKKMLSLIDADFMARPSKGDCHRAKG